MIDFNQNITKELQASAERFFIGFGENTRSVEVKIYEKEHVEPSLETKLCLRNFLFV